jgi:hypothetical protein
VAIPLILIALLVGFAGLKRDRFTSLLTLTYAALLGLLAYMSVRNNWSGVNWSYLEEPRYCRFSRPSRSFGSG